MAETKRARRDRIDGILAGHGCEIQPGANGQTVVVVQPRYQRGWPQDDDVIAEACAEVEALYPGATAGWLS